MEYAEQPVEKKWKAILKELAGDRARRLENAHPDLDVKEVIAKALATDYPPDAVSGIAFHLTDWSGDAAFLVTLHLFPERFTADEIRTGVVNFLVHVPNHLAAAAKLVGHPIQDVFGLGMLVEEPNRSG
jgi:hypothetical protein